MLQKNKAIYFDHAATALPRPEPVISAVVEAMRRAGNAGRGLTEPSLYAAETIFDCRARLTRFFGGDEPEQLIFTSNVTEALNIALYGLLRAGDHVLTDDSQHNSVIRPLSTLAAERGIELEFVRLDALGRVTPDDYERLLRPNTRAIVCQHGSNLSGNIFDLASFSELARRRGVLLIVDCAQTAGLLKLDLRKTPVDVLCFTGHKSLLGPQGTGGMLLAPGIEPKAFKSGGTGTDSYNPLQPDALPDRLEAGTLNCHGIAGLGAAVKWIEEQGVERLFKRADELSRRFIQGLREIRGATLYGDVDAPRRLPIVSFNLEPYGSGELADALALDYGIACRGGAHCAPRLHLSFGTEMRGAVRFSFAHSNTEEEVDTALAALRELAGH